VQYFDVIDRFHRHDVHTDDLAVLGDELAQRLAHLTESDNNYKTVGFCHGPGPPREK
jgi:hypothetical protein